MRPTHKFRYYMSLDGQFNLLLVYSQLSVHNRKYPNNNNFFIFEFVKYFVQIICFIIEKIKNYNINIIYNSINSL